MQTSIAADRAAGGRATKGHRSLVSSLGPNCDKTSYFFASRSRSLMKIGEMGLGLSSA